MKLRLGSLGLLLPLTIAFAGDGIPPRSSADDYPAHQVLGKIAIGAAYVTPAQAKKLFGEDLEKRGYVVFEVGIVPIGDTEAEVSPDEFKLKGKDGSLARAATPHMVAGDVHPQRSPDAGIPGNVHVQTAETVGVGTAPYGQHGVYTASSVGVSNYPPQQSPFPGRSAGNDKLEQQVEEKSLPDIKTKRAVAGYVFFPKPSGDNKHGDYELLYLGTDGQVTLKLSPTK